MCASGPVQHALRRRIAALATGPTSDMVAAVGNSALILDVVLAGSDTSTLEVFDGSTRLDRLVIRRTWRLGGFVAKDTHPHDQ